MRLHDSIKAVHGRRQRQWTWQCLSTGLLIGGLSGCLLALVRVGFANPISIQWILACLTIGPLVGLIYSFLRPCRFDDAAVAIDRSCGLKDRVSSALDFVKKNADSPIHKLQIDDAEIRIESVEPEKVVPIVAPGSWAWGLGLALMAFIIGLLPIASQQVNAAPIADDVVVSQADRVENSLEELKEFSADEIDPELEKLLKELAEKVEELKLPGVDPKEALAKLSEMEAALQEQQEKLDQDNAEAALQEIGEAISLADPLKAAGLAMSDGDMEKAAEELEKLEMPELDRKTEKAIQKELEKVAGKSPDGAQKNLKNAISKFSEGMCNGNKSKFQEGVEGLAGQCKKQGRRKRLSDLLKKQCQCLCECKSECEGSCKSNGKGKGGKNWGLGASGNEPGDKTAKLKTAAQMQITGQESDSGDVDVETIKSNEQEQEAVRQYREKSGEYEQMSESVLSSEAIPLGHRQTIRRYFEMIRPEEGETDRVNDRTSQENSESDK